LREVRDVRVVPRLLPEKKQMMCPPHGGILWGSFFRSGNDRLNIPHYPHFLRYFYLRLSNSFLSVSFSMKTGFIALRFVWPPVLQDRPR
jgi:hypothetical protein